MEVEGAEARHCPDDLGEHSESDDHEKVGIEAAELLDKPGILETDGLEEMEAARECKLLDGRLVELMTASGRLIGHSDDTYYIISTVGNPAQRLNSEVGGAEKEYFQILFGHILSYLEGIIRSESEVYFGGGFGANPVEKRESQGVIATGRPQ